MLAKKWKLYLHILVKIVKSVKDILSTYGWIIEKKNDYVAGVL